MKTIFGFSGNDAFLDNKNADRELMLNNVAPTFEPAKHPLKQLGL
jgi:hypothetical protein